MKLLILLVLLTIELGYISCQYTAPPFHRTFSDSCIKLNIETEHACPRLPGKSQWSREKRTSESDTRFKPTNGNIGEGKTKRCFSKVSVSTQECNAKPECIMTTYKYTLPNRGRSAANVKPSHCTKDWTIQNKCKANGPGGKNTRSIFFSCFKKGARNYCGVNFEPCKPVPCFTWTGYKRQCFMECKTPKFTGVAMHFVRNCKECGGEITNNTNCSGGEDAASRLGRCVLRSKARHRAPDCFIDAETTTAIATKFETTKITKGTTPATTTTTATTRPATTRPTTTRPTTTRPTATSSVTIGPESTTFIAATKTAPVTSERKSKTVTIPAITTTTETSTKSTTTSATTATSKPTTHQSNTTSTEQVPKTRKARITTLIKVTAVPEMESTVSKSQTSQSKTTKGLVAVPGGQAGARDNDGFSFNLVTIAGGAGAGVIFIVLIAIIIFLLVRRDTKTQPDPTYSSSSLYRTRSGRNPVVDSSSFRIATWIRERPALPSTSQASTDSGVSDAEYWKIGESSGEEKPETSDKREDINDQKPVEGEEHIYDEVSFGVVEDEMRTFVPISRISPRKSNRTSGKSTQSEPAGTSTQQEWPTSESAVYAVVRKNRKKNANLSTKSDMEAGDLRRKVASEHTNSVTREGVLQIEFDEKEGLRCRLSNSNVYMNFEETETPPVF